MLWDILIHRIDSHKFCKYYPPLTLFANFGCIQKVNMNPYIFPKSHDSKKNKRKLKTIPFQTDTNRVQRLEADFVEDIAYYEVSCNDANPIENCIGICTRNLASNDDADFEMNCITAQNRKCRHPIFVFQLKWPKHERPDLESVFDASMHAVTSLGMGEHQSLVTVHHHKHCIRSQITINRVHPGTYKSKNIRGANKKLHFAARESELNHGWHHDDGMYIVVFDDEQNRHKIVRNRKFKNK